MAKFRFDDKRIRSLESPAAGNRIDYDIAPESGRGDFVRGFAVRCTAAGRKTFLLVYVTSTGQERRHKIGDYPTHTVTTAREAARKLRIEVDAGRDPFAAQKATRALAEAKKARERATFGELLNAYVDQLRRAKKPSAAKVAQEIARTIEEPFLALWKKPAADVTLDELVRIGNRLVREGKWRQAEKTRSYIRAAYTAAIAARGNAQTRDLFEGFEHLSNIARDLAAIARPADRSQPNAKRDLSADQLRAYWRRIRNLESPIGALLRAHLLTGAQRCEQLAKLTARDFDHEGKTVRLWDSKGRRKEPREHIVPLLPEASAAFKAMSGDRGPYLFTLTAGEAPAAYHSVREAVNAIAEAMVAAGEIEARFTPGELRMTVETRLQGLGVPKEHRSHLQSHGIAGVQDRHYGRYQFLDEKRAALEKLRGLLEPAGKVVPIRRKHAG
jgi:hypothetical protein